MAKNSRDYWKEREEEARRHTIQDEQIYEREIKRIYQRMYDNINREVNGFFVRYASKEGISISDAKKRVSKLDMAEYSRKAKEYVKNKDFSRQANEEMRIYNLTMKVNRLEMLKAHMGLEMVNSYQDLEDYMGRALNETTQKELQRQAGILGDSVSNPQRFAKQIVDGSFHHAKWSDRIWSNQQTLKMKLYDSLQVGLIQGRNPNVLARDIMKTMGASVNDASRLMRTEMCRVQTDAQMATLAANGFEDYEFIAERSSRTCDQCLAMDGKHFKVKDAMPGENAPPLHPNCRCGTAGWMDDKAYEEWLDSGAAADGVSFKDFSANYKAAGETGLGFEEPDETVKFSSSPSGEKNRAIRFGDSNSFEQYGRTVHTSEIKNSGNNLHIDKSISLSRKQIRDMDGIISGAKELHGISYTCNAPFVVTDNGGRIASYNPRTNTFFIDYRMADLEKITLQQQGFAAPNNIYSTVVHEIFHWKDAEEYRKSGNEIDRADFRSIYSQYNREMSKRKLKEAGIDISSPSEIARISQYAYLKWLENDLEEVYTEYRTKELLKG